MKTYLVEVSTVSATLVRASSQAQAERVALATTRGDRKAVVSATAVRASR